jgi:phosphoribosylanthranilate isomerase
MSLFVKICGITSLADANCAIEAGADALGFIFFRRSPRYIEPKDAAKIASEILAPVLKIGVFVDENPETMQEIARQCGLDRLQLHGSESRETCVSLQTPVIKAFRIQDQNSLVSLRDYKVWAFLLDSYIAGQLGGTGAKFNWDLAVQAKTFGTPIILAGGLNPENVADAVAKVSPFGVDVSSGVESAPGKKDHAKVREFIRRAKVEARAATE